jgi:DNA repair exonuclease SbcCD ATPase subunit
MNAEVIFENVGGLSGTYKLKLSRGVVNVVKAPNAAGKSSIIRSLALCISAPYKDKDLLNIAREMGLLKQPSEAIEPLVHVGANVANIIVKFDNEEWSFNLFKDGRYKFTREGDERTLITSILTRDSVILKKLMSGEMNFKWIIEKLSLAGKYEVVISILNRERDKISNLYEDVRNRRKEIEDLKKDQDKLKEELERYLRERDELNKKLSEILANRPELKTLNDQRNDLISKIKKQEQIIKDYDKEISKLKEELNNLTKEYEDKLNKEKLLEKGERELGEKLESIEERIKTLNEQLKGYEERLKDISDKIEALRLDEGRCLAEYEMYEKALKLATQAQEVRCFLCGQGILTEEFLEQRKVVAEKKLMEIRDRISELLAERNRIYSAINEKNSLEKQLNELNKEYPKIRKELEEIKEELSTYFIKINATKERMTKLEAERSKEVQILNEYESKLETIEKLIQEKGKDEQKIIEKLAEIRGRINELEKQLNKIEKIIEVKAYIEVFDHKLLYNDAEKKLDILIRIIDSVLGKVREEVRRERIMAIELFNDQIKKVLKDLGFDYLDIWIDASDYRLHILDKRVGSEVSPRILSETERYILALVLHIALKLAYTTHIPFFLIDEITLSFDEVRKRALLGYLSKLAKKNDWFIILTELSSEHTFTVTTLTSP